MSPNKTSTTHLNTSDMSQLDSQSEKEWFETYNGIFCQKETLSSLKKKIVADQKQQKEKYNHILKQVTHFKQQLTQHSEVASTIPKQLDKLKELVIQLRNDENNLVVTSTTTTTNRTKFFF